MLPGGVYTRVYIPYYATRVYIPGCTYPTIRSRVHPWVYTILLLHAEHWHRYTGRTVTKPWAQEGGNPWVGGKVRVNVVIPVRVDRSVCALLLRLSLKKGTTIG